MTGRNPESLRRARAAVLAGDVEGLRDMLRRDAGLANTRWDAVEPPYDSYFHRPTLLHHVAGNPEVEAARPLRERELAAALLEAGADIDALTEAGPSQPADIGWTTLGLVATSGRPGQLELLDDLVDAGADLDAPNGGALKGALYYGQAAAARRLAQHGAKVDFIAACGLGDLARLEAELVGGIEDLPRRPRLAHYSLVPLPEAVTPMDLLAIGLAVAAQHGRIEVMERLLALGLDPNRRPPYDHHATALHWAVIGEQPRSAAWLLAHGANPELRDASFRSTPRGWAEHLGRPQVFDAADG